METEQHDSKESCLQKECSQHFVRDQWSDYWPGNLRESGEPQTKLERKDDSGDYSDAKAHGKNVEPESVNLKIKVIFRFQPEGFYHCKEGSEPN
jgi:hypothetical protein